MKNIKVIFMVILFLFLSMSIPSVTLSAEEAPDFVTKVVLKDGKVINCDMGWIDGDTFMYRKYGGTMGMPLMKVDLDKTFKRSKEAKTETSYNGSKMSDFGDIVVSGWDVYGQVIPRGRSKRYKIFISATVTNEGDPGIICLSFKGFDPNDYFIKKTGTCTKNILWPGETEHIYKSFLASCRIEACSRISRWEFDGVRKKNKYSKAKEKKRKKKKNRR